MASTDAIMRQEAWLATKRGSPSKSLVLSKTQPIPSELKHGEVLVKVQAAALNPIGYKLMKMLPNFIARRPLVPENDIAGTIVSSTVPEFVAGEQVFGWIPSNIQRATSQGALSQYTRLPATHIVHRPSNITPTQASGVALVATTAWDALFGIAEIQASQKIFVNGGSTAVGSWAIMLAKAKGCWVTASASNRNEAYVMKLGADEFIDYTAAPLATYLRSSPPDPKFDVIFDAAGLNNPDLYVCSPAYLKPNGVFISTFGGPKAWSLGALGELLRTMWWCLLWPGWAGGVKRKYKIVRVKNGKHKLLDIKDHLEKHPEVVHPVVDSVFAFKDVLKAYDLIMSGHATGKVVVRVEDEVE